MVPHGLRSGSEGGSIRPRDALALEPHQTVYLRSASARRCQLAEVVETFQRIPRGMTWVRVFTLTDSYPWDNERELPAGVELVVPSFAVEEVRW